MEGALVPFPKEKQKRNWGGYQSQEGVCLPCVCVHMCLHVHWLWFFGSPVLSKPQFRAWRCSKPQDVWHCSEAGHQKRLRGYVADICGPTRSPTYQTKSSSQRHNDQKTGMDSKHLAKKINQWNTLPPIICSISFYICAKDWLSENGVCFQAALHFQKFRVALRT